MKTTVLKTLAVCAIIITALAFSTTSGGGGIAKGEKYVNYSFPDSISASETVLFPTYEGKAPAWVSDSANVKVGEFYTYVAPTTALSATRRIKLSTQTYVTGGAHLWIEATSDSIRNLVIVQSTRSDTVSVRYKNSMQMLYTGSVWIPVSTFK